MPKTRKVTLYKFQKPTTEYIELPEECPDCGNNFLEEGALRVDMTSEGVVTEGRLFEGEVSDDGLLCGDQVSEDHNEYPVGVYCGNSGCDFRAEPGYKPPEPRAFMQWKLPMGTPQPQRETLEELARRIHQAGMEIAFSKPIQEVLFTLDDMHEFVCELARLKRGGSPDAGSLIRNCRPCVVACAVHYELAEIFGQRKDKS